MRVPSISSASGPPLITITRLASCRAARPAVCCIALMATGLLSGVSRGLFEYRLGSSKGVKNLQHTVHDRVTCVFWSEYSCDYIHGCTMGLPPPRNGSLVFVNRHENPVLKRRHIVVAGQTVGIYSSVH